jgi:hypothetical protein
MLAVPLKTTDAKKVDWASALSRYVSRAYSKDHSAVPRMAPPRLRLHLQLRLHHLHLYLPPSTSASGFRYVTRAYSKEHAAAHAEQFACMLTRAASGYAYQPAGCCTYQRHRAACPGRAVHTAYRGTPGSPPWPRCTNSAPTCWRSVRTCSMPRAGTAAARTRWASAQRSRRCCGTTACSARSRRVCYRGLQPQTSRQSQAGLLYSHACASPRTGFEAQQLRIVFPWRDAFQPNAKQAEARLRCPNPSPFP